MQLAGCLFILVSGAVKGGYLTATGGRARKLQKLQADKTQLLCQSPDI